MNDDAPLLNLLELGRRARAARSPEELAFLAVNDTHRLQPYRQAVLWQSAGGVTALSGVVQIEANVPYVQWVQQVCEALHAADTPAGPVSAAQLPDTLAAEWAEWLPAFGLWLPMGPDAATALLLAADTPWDDATVTVLAEWADTWHHAWEARQQAAPWHWRQLRQRAVHSLQTRPGQRWWQQGRVRLAAALLLACLWPVRLTVLAPGELVPAHPAVVRAPIDGVVGQFHVRPNEAVKAGQVLFGFDEAPLQAKLDVALQTLATAQAEYRQFAQQAVSDPRSKSQLASLLGKVAERKAEADYLREQLQRARVVAPRDGIVLFDDPSEWVGKPVQTGERILRVAATDDVEVEAWVPLADAIPLPEAAPLRLYLAADPLHSLEARTRYFAYEATLRPEGHYAYRLRARLDEATQQRVGQKGTVKLGSDRVPLVYWVLRRPWATVRQALGW